MLARISQARFYVNILILYLRRNIVPKVHHKESSPVMFLCKSIVINAQHDVKCLLPSGLA